MTTINGEAARHAFLSAADAAVELLRSTGVAARWDSPSALEGWAVSGLAGHLGRAVLTVSRYLRGDAPPPDTVTVDPAGYMLAAIDDDDLDVDSRLYAAIRARGDEEGARGRELLVDSVTRELAGLRDLLSPGPDRVAGSTLVSVLDGITMTIDDYLATRVVELVVHLDDLAVSIDDTDFPVPAQALSLATDVVVDLARRRRGNMTVLHLLARRERAPVGPIAF